MLAERVIASISWLMSNLGGLSEGKRKLLANIGMSILLYGAPIWADAINAREYWKTDMVLVQPKAAIKCVSAYHTVSAEAVCVLAGIPLSEIIADERKRVYSTTHCINPEWKSDKGQVWRKASHTP